MLTILSVGILDFWCCANSHLPGSWSRALLAAYSEVSNTFQDRFGIGLAKDDFVKMRSIHSPWRLSHTQNMERDFSSVCVDTIDAGSGTM